MLSILTTTIRGEKGLKPVRESLAKQSYKDFEWLIEDHNPKEPPDFNKAMNRLIRKAKGELIVIVQDYIKVPENGLESFLKAYHNEPDVAFTAPVIKEGKKDWRCYKEECNFLEWECDYASIPRKMIVEIGGFDEELDKQWGFDNVNVGLRIEMAGYKIKCLKNNRATVIDHNKIIEHPYQKLRNPDFHNARLDEIRMGLKIGWKK